VLTGDDFPEILGAIKAADVIVVGSPVYFGSATPELMALLDRAGYVARCGGENFLSRKIGGPVTVARRAGQNFTFAQLLYWFLINDMVVPGSTYWNVAFGRAAGDVQDDIEGLETVDRFADNLIWLAEKLRARTS
jgi:multimeric flavodoxin WrbA